MTLFSPSRKLDQEMLLLYGDMIKVLIKTGATEVAEEYGKLYVDLEQKLKTFDYEAEDKKLEAWDNQFKNQ